MSRAHPRRFFRHGLLPQLLVFEAVARLGSVTRAGAELHLAQPTVSLQLKKLAATLEVTLFEQEGRSLRLTGAGHTLLETCDELIGWCAAALAKFKVPRYVRFVSGFPMTASGKIQKYKLREEHQQFLKT